MPRPLDKKLILNRQAFHSLHEAGLKTLTDNLPDINAARQFALWRKGSGAEIYLLVLLTAATRQIVSHFFDLMNLQPGHEKVDLSGKTHPLPGLDAAYFAFLDCYPRDDLAMAAKGGLSITETAPRKSLLAELFVLETLVENPATRSFHDLFDDCELKTRYDYHALLESLNKLSGPLKGHVDRQHSLSELLRAPMRAAPDNLAEQVSYIARTWAAWLPDDFIAEIQLARAIVAEENKPYQPGPGPSPSPLFGTGDGSESPAAFSADIDWMAKTVLLAKSIHVWLDQLSNRYGRSIATLADIPEEELACLAAWGFNAIWLIGIWERSKASKRIKQLCGNPEAEASAYALHAYRVAEDLGGESALRDLEQRCHSHGIRLACDVVPNHTGIDSEWIEQHPDWFLQTDQPPYPAYSFSGPDLCEADATSIRIEDGYWDHSDAAVVCEHHDHQSGRRRYIYHGNDGTHMPWNDTAQLNFLLPDVRRAMSDLIVNIAQRFSLIRFDAAMTLARKHFRRLWFPPPGGSAGVPSRSAFWMSDADFEKAFPVEFWREVVDRINLEAPDTLLIAEAFWMMESYFVRNLGMHRVYNSAFMNMLKREENAKYRKILKDVLAYNPEILKRHVNFMNNPDEATAVEQFDKGDKYFGVATLLATLPGLPMFGHGQIEGYREKYGMEYRRAYWKEEPDAGFVAHHEQQVFPLLRIRWLFAGVNDYSLYDFSTTDGVNENVYAFSNGPIARKALVVYNNCAHQTEGRLHHAAPKAAPGQENEPHPMPPLWEELGLDPVHGEFCRYRNLLGAEYLLKVEQAVEGLEMRLDGYEHQVFHDFQLFNDPDGCWQLLYSRCKGRAVDNLDREILRTRHQPLWDSFTRLFDPGRLRVLAGGLTASPQTPPVKTLIAEIIGEFSTLVEKLRRKIQALDDNEPAAPPDLGALLTALPGWLEDQPVETPAEKLMMGLWYGNSTQSALGAPLLGWLLLRSLGKALDVAEDIRCLDLLRQFGLDFAWLESTTEVNHEREVALAILLMQTAALVPHPAHDSAAFTHLCQAPENSWLLGINAHEGETWFSREGMTALAGVLALQARMLSCLGHDGAETPDSASAATADVLRQRLARAAAVGYRLDKFLHLG